jgi:predicted nuclease of predicted toxin-antitoxin system
MARFLLDENVDARLATFLRELGHDVQAIAVDYPHALADEDVLAIALSERRVLVTGDQDFGELVVRDGRSHAGVILLRLRTTELSRVQARLSKALNDNQDRLTEFLVVTDRTVRPHRG